MKKFASHRLYVQNLDKMFCNQVVEIEETTGRVLSFHDFSEETSFTEWLNGLMVISHRKPCLHIDYGSNEFVFDGSVNETTLYVDEQNNIRSIATDGSALPLMLYYITDFNVSDMKFSESSRVVQLY